MTPDLPLAIIGAGRLGSALGAALRAAGLPVIGPLGRSFDLLNARTVLLCVPDAAIAELSRALPGGLLVGHCSGATTLEPLTPHEAFSVHPLLTVAGGATSAGLTGTGSEASVSFSGVGCAIAGSTDHALGFARELAHRLGMHPFTVRDEDRDLYHAAASMASNYLVALEGAVERLGTLAGVERAHLVPLVRAAVENWAQLGARRALTGPIARGDELTVTRQRNAIERRAPEFLSLWDCLTSATRELAADTGPAPA
jgi:predicted short-subunit dehydrogenase-like oxidoreductase (DUF2520 family)